MQPKRTNHICTALCIIHFQNGFIQITKNMVSENGQEVIFR